MMLYAIWLNDDPYAGWPGWQFDYQRQNGIAFAGYDFLLASVESAPLSGAHLHTVEREALSEIDILLRDPFGGESKVIAELLVVPEPSALACGLIAVLAGCGYRIKQRLR